MSDNGELQVFFRVATSSIPAGDSVLAAVYDESSIVSRLGPAEGGIGW